MAANSEIVYRMVQQADLDALAGLWHRVFGDEPAYALHSLQTFVGMENILAAEQEGAPVAMLCMVPCTLEDQQGVYLYALATQPAQRGRGVMSALMAESERLAIARGCVFSVLIPASQSLYGYYEKRGYAHTLFLRDLLWDDKAAEAGSSVTCTQPTADRLRKLRNQWLNVPTVEFCGQSAAAAMEDVANAGAVLAESALGYAVALPLEGQLRVAELAAADDAAADQLLYAVRQREKAEAVRVTLPGASPLWRGRGTKKPAALLKPLTQAFCFDQRTYLRFAMDEAFGFDLPAG